MDERICSVEGCGPTSGQYRRGMCSKHYDRWYRSDAERRARVNAQKAKDRERNRAHVNEQSRGYYNANPERFRLANERYAEAHPERRAETYARYRATPNGTVKNREKSGRVRAKLKAPADQVDYVAVLAEHGMVCHICRDPIGSLAELNFDHVIPLSKGGPHVAENIRPAHATCNKQKGARLIE